MCGTLELIHDHPLRTVIATSNASLPKGFYSTKEAARIARVPAPTLRSWGHIGVILPSVAYTNDDGKTEKGYDFDALLLARLLRVLREHKVGLKRAVATLRHCIARFGPPGPAWAEVKVFAFDGGQVFTYIEKDGWETTVPTKGGQKAAEDLFGAEFYELKENADALLIPKNFIKCVQIDPEIRDGMPVVRGTRIRTSTLQDMVEANWTPRLVVDLAYPHLTEEQVECAEEYERFLDG